MTLSLDRTPGKSPPMPDDARRQINAGRARGLTDKQIATKLFCKNYNEVQIALAMEIETHVVKSYLFARVG
ncbi:hypothetical protein ACSMXM_05605 [Pacificimonas sp. ICDLI1SI03]